RWFVELLPINTATVESEISSGWNLGGIIYVTINPGYAYIKLYEQAKSALWFSTWTFLLAVALLLLILKLILLPLKKINLLALSIAHGQFDTIEQLPWTIEVRNVANSMNTMSMKIAKMIKNLNNKLEALGNKLQLDELTGLLKKSSFDAEMNQLFFEDSEAYIYLIKLDSLSGLVKENAADTIDAFLRDAANTLSQTAAEFPCGQANVYHFFGAEFAIVLRGVNFQQAEQCAKALSQALAELGRHHQLADVAHFGVAPFNVLSSSAGILAAANEAFEQAKLINANGFYIRTNEDQGKDISEWKTLVFDVVDNDGYRIDYVGAIECFQTGDMLMEEAFIQVNDAHGEEVAIGPFISIAEKFEKIVELDKGVLEKIIAYIAAEEISYAIAVNVSTRTIKNNDFRNWLSNKLAKNAQIAAQLVFSMSAYAVAKDFKVYKEFVEFVHSLGAKVMLKRFDNQTMSLDMAKTLRPDYLRMARELGNGLSQEPGKVAFVETLKDVSELLDMQVLAENVQTKEDFSFLKTMGIAGASR
ncbi:MAG: EAL domain-containing protein, partial [Methylococcales bacterium]